MHRCFAHRVFKIKTRLVLMNISIWSFYTQTCAFLGSLRPRGAAITGGLRDNACGSAWAVFNPTWLVGFQQANLIFLNTGLCFSFITAGSGGELRGLGGKAELIGLPEKPVDLNTKGRIIIIKNTCMCSLR